MTDDELRALVRDAIRRHLGGAASDASTAAAPVPLWRAHPSFGKYIVPGGDEQGGPCLIEPTVHCTHCGFCQSHGH
jgi:hypothetical protein